MDISKHVVLGTPWRQTQICTDTQWLPEFTMVTGGFEWRNTTVWGRRCSEFMGWARMRDGGHPLPSQGSHAPNCDYLQHAYLLESLCSRPTWPQLLKSYSLSRFLVQFQPRLTASPIHPARHEVTRLWSSMAFYLLCALNFGHFCSLSLSTDHSLEARLTAYSTPGPPAGARKHRLKSTGREIQIERSTATLKTSPQGTFETKGCQNLGSVLSHWIQWPPSLCCISLKT